MPAVEIDSPEHYSKALDVLTQVGGTFHGVGGEKRSLLVTEAQYRALVAAGVVRHNGGGVARRKYRGAERLKQLLRSLIAAAAAALCPKGCAAPIQRIRQSGGA